LVKNLKERCGGAKPPVGNPGGEAPRQGVQGDGVPLVRKGGFGGEGRSPSP